MLNKMSLAPRVWLAQVSDRCVNKGKATIADCSTDSDGILAAKNR